MAEQEVAALTSRLAVAQESLQTLETGSKAVQVYLERQLAAALAAATSPPVVDVGTSMEEEREEGVKAAAVAAERYG